VERGVNVSTRAAVPSGCLTAAEEPRGGIQWEPNYCSMTSKQQEEAGLKKSALTQFLGYPCDGMFFQCRWAVDGFRTYRKSCRKGLVFDTTGTQNCNYDFNVAGCGVKQCGMLLLRVPILR